MEIVVGLFFAASAFRDTTPDALAAATADYGLRHSVRTSVVTEPYPINDSTDALFYQTVAGWTVASWPK